MKPVTPKFVRFISLVWLISLFALAACTPTTSSDPTPTPLSATTAPPTAETSGTATSEPTAIPAPPTETPVPTPTVFPPANYFRLVSGFSYNEQGNATAVNGLGAAESGEELRSLPLDPPIPTYGGQDYALATNRLLYWVYYDYGVGPATLSAGTLRMRDLVTGEDVELIPNVRQAAWMPNGVDFAYILATDSAYELHWRSGADGTDRVLAMDVPRSFTVSPSGRWLAFTRESRYLGMTLPAGLYLVDVTTGEERQLSDVDREGSGGSGRFSDTTWSPDETSVLLSLEGTPQGGGFEWAAVDGSFSHRLTLEAINEAITAANTTTDELCLSFGFLFTGDMLLSAVGICADFGPAETLHLAAHDLDAATGQISASRLIPVGQAFELLTWDTPGESVLINVGGTLQTVSLTGQ